MLLGIPTTGYLEGPGGPTRIADVEYVELSTHTLRGGLAGRPLETIDIKNQLCALLEGTDLRWSLIEKTWTIERFFRNRPVEIIRVMAP